MDKKNQGVLKNKIFLYLTEFFAGMSVMAVELGQKYGVKVILTHFNPETDKKLIENECFGNYEISEINKSYTI